MYVTTLRIPSLEGDYAKAVIEGLNRMVRVIDQAQTQGHLQSLLLRDAKGGALLLSFWQGRGELERFMRSDAGRETSAIQKEIFPAGKQEAHVYRKTWQAYGFYEDLIAQFAPHQIVDTKVGCK